MSENITRTIYGSLLQTVGLLGLPFSVKPNTTLNEKFGIQAGILPDISETPRMRYYGIGMGGHRMSVGGNGIAKPEPIQHRAVDGALMRHLPFVLREPSNDLPVSERVKYAMRRIETWNGLPYAAYYLKRLPLTNVAASMEYKTVTNGETVTSPFTPDASNLNPVPPQLNSSGVSVVSGDYVTATAKITIAPTQREVDELLAACRIIYDDDGMAIISEIALVSGVDKDVQSPGVGNATITFKEVIAAQICAVVSSFFPLKFANDGFQTVLDVGSTEAMYKIA